MTHKITEKHMNCGTLLLCSFRLNPFRETNVAVGLLQAHWQGVGLCLAIKVSLVSSQYR